MIAPNETQIRALVKLSGNDDFRAVMEWFAVSELAALSALAQELDDTNIRRLQGDCRTLRSIREHADGAENALAAMTQRRMRADLPKR